MAIELYCPAPCWMLISAQWAEISRGAGTGGAKGAFAPLAFLLRVQRVQGAVGVQKNALY